jgi:starvation-inducible DNA-binding protein
MNNLSDALKKVLSDTFLMYFKTHAFHWNVEGPDFAQYHKFLKELYDELFDAVDSIAEHIRTLDVYTPISLKELLDNSLVEEETSIVTKTEMFSKLLTDNDLVVVSLMQAYKEAEDASELGIANFLQDRIDIHNKHGWMLRSITK